MRPLAMLLLLLGAVPASAYTIDFKAASGFVVGQAPPPTYATPWGDVEFSQHSVIAEDPFGPGLQMLSPTGSASEFGIRLPVGIFEVEILLVNPAEEQMVVSYFDAGWDDCGGSPCYDEFGDAGITIDPGSQGVLVLDGHGATYGSAGPLFYSGAHPDFDSSRDCDETPEGCYYGWGVASITWAPEPGTALLVSLGLVGLGARRRVRR